MAFTYPWTESEPTDQTYVREVDDWIRRLALSTRERLAIEHYVYVDESGMVNVGKHKPGSAKVLAGPSAGRPAVDANAPGTLYAVTDANAETLQRDSGSAWLDVLCKPRKHGADHEPTGSDPLAGYALASDVVTAPAANKILKLDADAKLPASITGNAPTATAATTAENANKLGGLTAAQLLPPGTIVMWSGSIASIPAGWALCDGTNGTPDLRDRFIVGAGSGYAVGATGGEAQHTLTVAEMPVHTHTYVKNTHSSSWGPVSGAGYVNQATDNTGSAGSGQPHENRPPYYALAFIMRLPY